VAKVRVVLNTQKSRAKWVSRAKVVP